VCRRVMGLSLTVSHSPRGRVAFVLRVRRGRVLAGWGRGNDRIQLYLFKGLSCCRGGGWMGRGEEGGQVKGAVCEGSL
jgi:hypothetical protein